MKVPTRDCPVHGIAAHGPLYSCPAYDAETLAAIHLEEATLFANLNDPGWCRQQIAAGTLDEEGIEILKWFVVGNS